MKYLKLKNKQLQENTCNNIIENLSEWFDIKESNIFFIKAAGNFNCFAAIDSNEIIGMIVIDVSYNKLIKQRTANILWLGIMPEYHRQGIGTKLLNYALELTKKQSYVNVASVETLDPEIKNPFYLKTYNFYKKNRFIIFNKFKYDEKTPMIVLIKNI